MRLLFLLAAITGLSFGGQVRDTDRIFPLVRDGGGIWTEITVVNLESKDANYELIFRTGALEAWAVPASGAGSKQQRSIVRGMLPAGGSVTIRTAGAKEATERGFAFLFSPDAVRLGGKSVVRGKDGVALAVPLSPEREDRLVLAFDNTEGARTALLWLSETPFAMVDFQFRDTEGAKILEGNFQFSAASVATQEIFFLDERFPQLQGMKGTMKIDVSYPNATIYDELFFTALAMQRDASGAVSMVGSMATDTWRSGRY